MRIVATSDTHTVPTLEIPDGDVFIHAGDLMVDGYPSEWESRVEWLASLPHAVKIFVAGNHDFHLQVYPGPALQNLRSAGVLVVGRPAFKEVVELPNGMKLMGLPGVSKMCNWAFNRPELDMLKHVDDLVGAGKVDIVVSHSPVRGILDFSHRDQMSVGIGTYRSILTKCKPSIWICGHIHEGYGTAEYADCKFYNVCMSNRIYQHVNYPMVIEV